MFKDARACLGCVCDAAHVHWYHVSTHLSGHLPVYLSARVRPAPAPLLCVDTHPAMLLVPTSRIRQGLLAGPLCSGLTHRSTRCVA